MAVEFKKILNYFNCQTSRVTYAAVSEIFWNSLQKALLNKSLGNFQTRLYISHSYYDALILIFDKWSKLETTNILNSYSRNQSLSNHFEGGSNDTANVSLLGFIWQYTFEICSIHRHDFKDDPGTRTWCWTSALHFHDYAHDYPFQIVHTGIRTNMRSHV